MRWAAGGYVRLRQRAVRGDDARCVELFAYQKHSLNGSEDNSVAEVVALRHVLPERSEVVAERDLLVKVGLGTHVAGTPDGAAFLASGNMHAVQVVRADEGQARRGLCAKLVRVLLAKVVKSLHWLTMSSLGRTICSFTIACWLPRALPRRTLAGLRRALRRCGADARFEYELLVPANGALRRAVFPDLFGTAPTQRKTTRSLLGELRALAARVEAGAADDGDDGALPGASFLGPALGAA